jgi:sugar lactone lactonase YvrE
MVDETPDFEPLASGFEFVEAPRVADDGTVYFSDLTGGGYHRVKPGGVPETLLEERMWIGGAALVADGSLILSGRGGLVRLDPAAGATSPILTDIDGRRIVAVNDIEPDARGGLFGGTVDFGAIFERNEIPNDGIFFHLSRAGELTVLREGLIVSNGLGFSPDGRRLYHSECTRGIWVYDLDAGGMPGAPQLFAPMEDSDGLVVDQEGGVWVACWSTARILRFWPDGRLDRSIRLPFPSIVSLAFGGPRLHQLYVATGGNAEHPGQGGIVRISVDVPGLPPAVLPANWASRSPAPR